MGVPNEIEVVTSKPAAGWREPAALVLDEGGIICECNPAGEALFGYSSSEVSSQGIARLLPQLDGIKLVQDGEINPMLVFLSRCGHHFLARPRHGGTIPCELSLVNVGRTGKLMLRLILRPAAAQAA